MKIELKSIGIAKNKDQQHFGGWKTSRTDIILDKEYQDALDGLKDYSHLMVIYFMHEVTACELSHVPQGKVGQVRLRSIELVRTLYQFEVI